AADAQVRDARVRIPGTQPRMEPAHVVEVGAARAGALHRAVAQRDIVDRRLAPGEPDTGLALTRETAGRRQDDGQRGKLDRAPVGGHAPSRPRWTAPWDVTPRGKGCARLRSRGVGGPRRRAWPGWCSGARRGRAPRGSRSS